MDTSAGSLDRHDPVDVLVKLYELPPLDLTALESLGIRLRRPLGPERHLVIAWVTEHFGPGWASETEVAFANRPRSCFVALRDQELLGFACYDATALGLFGPTGVAASARGQGVGAALLLLTLQAMHEQGYAYAVIGAAGPSSSTSGPWEASSSPVRGWVSTGACSRTRAEP